MQQQQQLDYIQLGHAHSSLVLPLFHISYVIVDSDVRN
jgi:hypothetical protein